MISKINILLLFAIIFLASDAIVAKFHRHQTFKELQALQQQHDGLLSSYKAYLSRYKSEYSLLKIEQRATNDLQMISHQYSNKL